MKIINFIIICLICMILNCCMFANKNTSTENLPPKASFIEFSIGSLTSGSEDMNSCFIQVFLKNVTKDDIVITKPGLWGLSGPFVFDSSGTQLQPLVRGHDRYPEPFITIKPGGAFESLLSGNIIRLYNMNTKGIHTVYYYYSGTILNENGKQIANNEPLKSNIIEINID